MRIRADMMIPGLDLLYYAYKHPLIALAIVFGIAAVTVLLIVLLKKRKGGK